jgi:hypothetical protein
VSGAASYSAYGLGLSASQPIPRLSGAPEADSTDVAIELDARPPWFADSLPSEVRFVSRLRDEAGVPALTVTELAAGWWRLKYSDGTDFLVDSAGTEIWATWADALSLDDVCSYLLGPVMGVVLRLRGQVCLHASGVAVEGRAIAILGPAGAGKSTIVGAFAAHGHAVLTDDIVPLRETLDGFLACPGYPRVRLWPASLEALMTLDSSLPRLPAAWTGRYHLNVVQHGYGFESKPLPLQAIYLLGPRANEDHAPRVTPLSGERGLMALVANSFAGNLLDRAMRQHDFLVLSRLAGSVPLRHVTPHANPDRLSALCHSILNDFLAQPVPAATCLV